MVWLSFALLTIVCWGMYGPILHTGQIALGSPWRALLCVGLAYFLVGVLAPSAVILTQGEGGSFTAKGSVMATLAGTLGAVGAVGIIYAFRNHGTPLIVMPLVFGGAPIVNVAFSTILHPPKSATSPWLYLGFILAAVGAGLILRFKPE